MGYTDTRGHNKTGRTTSAECTCGRCTDMHRVRLDPDGDVNADYKLSKQDLWTLRFNGGRVTVVATQVNLGFPRMTVRSPDMDLVEAIASDNHAWVKESLSACRDYLSEWRRMTDSTRSGVNATIAAGARLSRKLLANPYIDRDNLPPDTVKILESMKDADPFEQHDNYVAMVARMLDTLEHDSSPQAIRCCAEYLQRKIQSARPMDLFTFQEQTAEVARDFKAMESLVDSLARDHNGGVDEEDDEDEEEFASVPGDPQSPRRRKVKRGLREREPDHKR